MSASIHLSRIEGGEDGVEVHYTTIWSEVAEIKH